MFLFNICQKGALSSEYRNLHILENATGCCGIINRNTYSCTSIIKQYILSNYNLLIEKYKNSYDNSNGKEMDRNRIQNFEINNTMTNYFILVYYVTLESIIDY